VNKQQPTHLSPECTRFGEWLASCGPKDTTPRTTYYVAGVISILIGVGLFLVPRFVEAATPQDAAGAPILFGVFGGFLIFVGLSMFVIPLFLVPIEVAVHSVRSGSRVNAH
jgi:hypothetical protein